MQHIIKHTLQEMAEVEQTPEARAQRIEKRKILKKLKEGRARARKAVWDTKGESEEIKQAAHDIHIDWQHAVRQFEQTGTVQFEFAGGRQLDLGEDLKREVLKYAHAKAQGKFHALKFEGKEDTPEYIAAGNEMRKHELNLRDYDIATGRRGRPKKLFPGTPPPAERGREREVRAGQGLTQKEKFAMLPESMKAVTDTPRTPTAAEQIQADRRGSGAIPAGMTMQEYGGYMDMIHRGLDDDDNNDEGQLPPGTDPSQAEAERGRALVRDSVEDTGRLLANYAAGGRMHPESTDTVHTRLRFAIGAREPQRNVSPRPRRTGPPPRDAQRVPLRHNRRKIGRQVGFKGLSSPQRVPK